jgi:hypothetical protein
MAKRDAAYYREWRAKRGARTGTHGFPATQPHGTLAAARRHERHGEPLCPACRAARSDENHRRYAARRGGQVERRGQRGQPATPNS